MTEEEAFERLTRDVSRETRERLEAYHRLLLKWQTRINLIAPNTLSTAWHRHFLDSAQVFDARVPTEGLWLDIGSGAGFPGLVCAMLASEAHPNLDFLFIESDARKATFLRQVVRETGLRAQITTARIEDAAPSDAAVVSARALASLTKLLTYAVPHLAPDGLCLFQKGATWRQELASAEQHWHMDVTSIPSTTHPDAVVLKLENIRHVP